MNPLLQTIEWLWLPAAVGVAAVHAWVGRNIVNAGLTLFLLLTVRELVFHLILPALHPLTGPPETGDLWRLLLCLLLPMVYTAIFLGIAFLVRGVRNRNRRDVTK